jgi:hypothetical protein
MSTTSTFKIPGGKSKGTPLHEADDKTLRWWFDKLTAGLAENPEKQWAAQDRAWLADARKILIEHGVDPAELNAPAPNGAASSGGNGTGPNGRNGNAETRGANGSPRRRLPDASSFSDGKQVIALLEEIEKDYNIVGAVALGEVPLGHSVVLTVVRIGTKEWHKQENGYGLAGSALSRIADAAGVSTTASVQTAYDPRGMCRFVVSVARQELSGGVRSETKSGLIDLRPGTKEYEAMLAEGKARRQKAIADKWDRVPDEDGQIRAKLKHLPALAETKGFLRAVRKLLALDRSYSDEEKTKPFAVMKLSFTGRCPENPRVEMMFARGLMQASLGGVATLYGRAGGMAAPQLAAPAQPIGLLHGGPIHEGDFADDDDDAGSDVPPARPTPRPRDEDPFDDMGQPYGDEDDGEERY